MPQKITQPELRDGTPVGKPSPAQRRQYVPIATVLKAFAGSAPIDSARFRADVDRLLDPGIEPRA